MKGENMGQKTYQISEAEKMTGEKAHVLRYWEEELALTIGRNEQGHRLYTAADIRIFRDIKELKKKGLHLKAIRELLPMLKDGKTVAQVLAGEQEEPAITGSIKQKEPVITESAKQEKPVITGSAKQEKPVISESVKQEKPIRRQEQFYDVLERLIGQEKERQREEARYRRVDEEIRKRQQYRKEAAVTEEQRKRRKKDS